MRTRFVHTPAFPTAFDGLSLVDDALRTFDRMWRNPAFARPVTSAWTGAPEMTVETNDDGWVLRAEVPGLTPDALEIEAHGDRLTVRAKREAPVPEGYRAIHRERGALSFERRFDFGRGFDAENVKAELKHGILTIRVPRRPDEKPRAITVTAE